MRGTLRDLALSLVRPRFIPAYAGNTSGFGAFFGSTSVHPRICGEHWCGYSTASLRVGSSPHMRGTHPQEFRDRVIRRFIPAYAGNTTCRPAQPTGSPVHPRICGEHPGHRRTHALNAGSSPHMRGTHKPFLLFPPISRFIPAYAGNTLATDRPSKLIAVHPRICGEHFACCQ